MSPHGDMALAPSQRDADCSREHERLEQLTNRLPRRLQPTVRWLRRPSSRWVRIPASLFLMAGSGLSLLPFFGLWMLPLGLFLLAEDLPPLRRARGRLLDRIARRRPHWFAEDTDTNRAHVAPGPGEHRPPN